MLQKSSFNKFDALTKKNVLHVRSLDASKVHHQLNSVSVNIFSMIYSELQFRIISRELHNYPSYALTHEPFPDAYKKCCFKQALWWCYQVGQNGDANLNCRSCGKVVFQMEQTKAEGLVWHKNCFRCVQCSKQLNVDNYESNECILYCKAHFKELFQPKPVEESDQPGKNDLK